MLFQEIQEILPSTAESQKQITKVGIFLLQPKTTLSVAF